MQTANEIIENTRLGIDMRMRNRGVTKESLAIQLNKPERFIYNQLRYNQDMNHSFVVQVDQILNQKQSTVLELMSKIHSLILEFESLRADYLESLKDQKVTEKELNNIKAKGELIKDRIDELVSELNEIKNIQLEVL